MLNASKELEIRTGQDDGGSVTQPDVALSRADLGWTEECRQFAHWIAFLCFAGDAVVACASLLVAFWLRFDTALHGFGVKGPRAYLSSYYNYLIVGVASLVIVLAQRQMYDGSWLRRNSAGKDVIIACLIWGLGFLSVSLFFEFQPPLSRVYVALAPIPAMTAFPARWTTRS
jgi:hypothetical protein